MNESQILNLVTPNMHVARRKSLLACVTSMLQGANATVTSIGRGISSSAKEKHNIKRADRLLSNTHLLTELAGIYGLIGRLFSSSTSPPVIHIDWSDLDEYKRHFLDVLSSILPTDATPIIVTDAGFKTPWFRAVLNLGWHYVGRARKPNFYHSEDEDWQCITSLYSSASSRPKDFKGQFCRCRPLSTNFVLYKQKAQGRHKLNRSGEPCRSKHSKASASRNRDPWLLVTSLPAKNNLGKRVVNIYKTRMQIEETFRDMKSPRYALGFNNNLSKDTSRLRILVLLTTLALLVATLLGWTVKTANKHRRYQANSLKSKDVLSLMFIGLRAFADNSLILTPEHWSSAIQSLKLKLTEENYVSI